MLKHKFTRVVEAEAATMLKHSSAASQQRYESCPSDKTFIKLVNFFFINSLKPCTRGGQVHSTTGWVIQYLQELGAMYLHSSCKYCPAVCAPSQIERLNRDTRPALALADKTSRKLPGGNFLWVRLFSLFSSVAKPWQGPFGFLFRRSLDFLM